MKRDLTQNGNDTTTKMSTINPKIPISKDFKILSIDGGGIKGLHAAKLLSEIEQKIEKPIGEYFDMICGTSTGGLIALGITKGIPCNEIARFYEEYGPLIFPYESWIQRNLRKLKQFVVSTKYDNTELASALKTLLTDYQTMADTNHYLCIPAFNLTKGMPKIFKKPFNQYHADGRIKLMDVALATSAAPTFLPAVEIENCLYVDGGLFNNDPSLIGLTEAMDHFWNKTHKIDDNFIECKNISVLSIGIPSTSIAETPSIPHRRSFLKWKENLIQTAMTGSEYVAAYQTEKLVKSVGGTYYKIRPMELSTKQAKIIEMDNTSPDSLKTLLALGQALGDDYTATKWQEIEYFFNNTKSYK